MRHVSKKMGLVMIAVLVAVLAIAGTAQAVTVALSGADLNVGHNNADLRGSNLAGSGGGVIGTLIFYVNTGNGNNGGGPITQDIRERGVFNNSWLTLSAGTGYVRLNNWNGYPNPVQDDYGTGINMGDAAGGVNLCNLTVGAGFRSDFRLGVIMDASDTGGAWTSDEVQLTIGGVSATTGDVSTDQNDSIDIYWFEIKDLQLGDVIDVGQMDGNINHMIGGFIVAIPEPATILGLLGSLGMLALRRRR